MDKLTEAFNEPVLVRAIPIKGIGIKSDICLARVERPPSTGKCGVWRHWDHFGGDVPFVRVAHLEFSSVSRQRNPGLARQISKNLVSCCGF